MRGSAYTPNIVRLANGKSQGVEWFGDKAIWSSIMCGSAQSIDAEFFGYSKGDLIAGDNNGSTKADERHTNVTDKGVMAIDSAMSVHTIGFEFPYDISLAALGQLTDKVYMEFKLGGASPVFTGLVRHFPAGNGVTISGTANAVSAYNNGYADQKRFGFAEPLGLMAGKKYGATAHFKGGAFTMASADVLFRLVYRGLALTPPV